MPISISSVVKTSRLMYVYTQDHQTDFTHVYSIKVEIDSVDITVEVSYGLNIC